MIRSVKQIDEDLDDLRNELEGYIAAANATGRDLSAAQGARVQSIEIQVRKLREERAEARNKEEQIKAMATHPSGTVYGMMNSGAPEQILPTNGRLPDGERAIYPQHVGVARPKAFPNVQAAFDAGQWFKAVVARAFHDSRDERAEEHCRSRGLQITNAAYEGSGPAGGYVVPAPISTAIIETREKVGVARQICDVQPMTSDTLTVPKRAGGVTVYVVNEMQTITDSSKSWSQVAVAAEKRACLSYLSQELSDDALLNIVDNIVMEQAHALAEKEDDELINGTGASSYGGITGLLSSIGSAGVYTCDANENLWTEIDLSDITSTIGKLPDRYHTYGPSFICSHSFYNTVLLNLAFSAGGVSAAEVFAGSPNVKSFMGYRCYLTSKMPVATADSTKCLLFGAWSRAVLFGDRGGIRVSRSDDFKFAEDLISLKATSRYDMNVHDHGDSSNAGAYVALATNAA